MAYRTTRSLRLMPAVAVLLVGCGSAPTPEPGTPAHAATAVPAAAEMEAYLDSNYPADEPGAAVLVRHGDDTLVRDGYGMADLELGVAMAPEHVFRIGSITKQFTAVAILMLVEEGKLSLDDPITTFIPDYPTGGHRLTLEHLLHHTSGVHSYTALPTWATRAREDLEPDSIIALFRDHPLDFAPGEDWRYSNSGYTLLGKMVEVASGQGYAEFIEERLFRPSGMTNSHYGSERRIIPNRIEGYVQTGAGWLNDEYVSMTGPYAAGALLSTVDDLARWYDALENGQLVDSALLERAYTPARLPDGRSTRYGYGWMLGEIGGHGTIEHGGGIEGFLTYALRVPDEDLLVVVLTNRETDRPSPSEVAVRLAELALEESGEPVVVEVSRDELADFVGVYRVNEHERREITLEEGTLYSQRTGRDKFALTPVGDDEFLYPTGTRARFVRGDGGEVVSVAMQNRVGPERAAPRMDEEPGGSRQPINLPRAVLERYIGDYQFAPGATLEIRLREGALQAELTGTGLPPVMLQPESETRFYAPRVPAWLEFEPGAGGTADAVLVFMDGGETRAPRIRKESPGQPRSASPLNEARYALGVVPRARRKCVRRTRADPNPH